MGKKWTDEEKKIAGQLFTYLKEDINSGKNDDYVRRTIKQIVQLTKQGKTEEEIVEQLDEDIVSLSLCEDRLAHYFMET